MSVCSVISEENNMSNNAFPGGGGVGPCFLELLFLEGKSHNHAFVHTVYSTEHSSFPQEYVFPTENGHLRRSALASWSGQTQAWGQPGGGAPGAF